MEKIKHLGLAALILVALWGVLGFPGALHAEYDNIKSADVYPAVTIAATAGSNTTQTNPFRPLPKTATQSCMITGTGTSPKRQPQRPMAARSR